MQFGTKAVCGDQHRGERVMERTMACPNGIAFDETGRLYWTESMNRQVCRLDDGRIDVLATFSEPYVPDGMAFARDGRLFVCTTTSRSVTTLGAAGNVIGEILVGAFPTNCVFAGATLYITATMTAEICAAERTGTLWTAEIDGTGLPLLQGRIKGIALRAGETWRAALERYERPPLAL
jgi:sugar lactone lactonase YvrE